MNKNNKVTKFQLCHKYMFLKPHYVKHLDFHVSNSVYFKNHINSILLQGFLVLLMDRLGGGKGCREVQEKSYLS